MRQRNINPLGSAINLFKLISMSSYLPVVEADVPRYPMVGDGLRTWYWVVAFAQQFIVYIQRILGIREALDYISLAN